VERIGLSDYLLIGEAVTGVSARVLSESATVVTRAESALAAPFASFRGRDFYPKLTTKAAILCSRLIRNHPLPDGNKRSAFLAAVDFIKRNGAELILADEDVEDRFVTAIVALAKRELDESDFAEFLTDYVWPREATGRRRAPKDARFVVEHEGGFAAAHRVLSDGRTVRRRDGSAVKQNSRLEFFDKGVGDLVVVHEYEADITSIKVGRSLGQGEAARWPVRFNAGAHGSLSVWLDAISMSDVLSDSAIREAGDIYRIKVRESDWVARRPLSAHYRRSSLGDAIYVKDGWVNGPETVVKLGQVLSFVASDRYTEDWWLFLDGARWVELLTMAAQAVGHPWFDAIRAVRYSPQSPD